MSEAAHIHVVDGNSSRRAQLARDLYAHRFHPEIYDDLKEFAVRKADRGLLLLGDDSSGDCPRPSLDEIRQQASLLPTLMFAAHPFATRVVDVLSAGVLDYLEWPMRAEFLLRRIARVIALEGREMRRRRRRLEAEERVARLSPRERQVLVSLVRGARNQDVAEELGISRRTIEIHRANMIARLEAESSADAVRIGILASLDD